jgi:hypothetical protein
LVEQGLLESGPRRLAVRFVPTVPLLGLLAIGITRIAIGRDHDRAILACSVTFLVIVAFWTSIGRTRFGARTLKQYQLQHAEMKAAARSSTKPLAQGAVALATAWLGQWLVRHQATDGACAGYRWERRADGLRLSIPLTPAWTVLDLGLGILVGAAAVVPPPIGDRLFQVSALVLVYRAPWFVVRALELGWCCPSWVWLSGNPFAITVREDELVAEWPDGRVRRIPRAAVVGVTARNVSAPGPDEAARWYVTVAVADRPPLSLDALHSKTLAGWLAATLCRELRLPAASATAGGVHRGRALTGTAGPSGAPDPARPIFDKVRKDADEAKAEG